MPVKLEDLERDRPNTDSPFRRGVTRGLMIALEMLYEGQTIDDIEDYLVSRAMNWRYNDRISDDVPEKPNRGTRV